jgi:tagatose 1,6-diphosphate aldolase
MFFKFASLRRPFEFLDAGSLVDGDLNLIAPSDQFIPHVLAARQHPLTRQSDPALAAAGDMWLRQFVRNIPQGRENGVLGPTYHFWMNSTIEPLALTGDISLRIAQSRDIVRYYGHIGYYVFPACRGRHYAERACRLLFPLAARHGLQTLWITTNPENIPSRRTCERLGGQLVNIVKVPPGHALAYAGDIEKCRYRIDLPA